LNHYYKSHTPTIIIILVYLTFGYRLLVY